MRLSSTASLAPSGQTAIAAIRALDLGIIDRFMPVIQGRRPDDYIRCAEALSWPLVPGTVIGVGSMCRREISGPEGLVAVVEHLDRHLPSTIRLTPSA